MTNETPEQQARDLLERMGIEDAQSFSSGDLVELANLIANKQTIIKQYTKLTNMVRDLYYFDGDLEKTWESAFSAIVWLRRYLDTIPQND